MEKVDVSASPMVQAALKVMDPKAFIETCELTFRMGFRLLVLGLAQAGFGRARVVCGHRSLDSQMVLYGYGRTQVECAAAGVPKIYGRPGRAKVTWVRPSDSKHVDGRAIDVDFSMYRGVTWETINRLAENLGLAWGGHWRVKDNGHFEI